MAVQLSKNFTLEEMVKSPTAERLGLKNEPSAEVVENLKALCLNVLEPVRAFFKKPVMINSGYRGPEVNEAVGGNPKGQHPKGEAVDFEIPGKDNFEVAQAIATGQIPGLVFDQEILEFYRAGEPDSGWIHLSFCRNGKNRGAVLRAVKDKAGKTVYKTGLK